MIVSLVYIYVYVIIIIKQLKTHLTFSSLQTKTDTFAKSVNPNKMAFNEQSYPDQHCLLFCFGFCADNPIFKQWTSQNSKKEESSKETQGERIKNDLKLLSVNIHHI